MRTDLLEFNTVLQSSREEDVQRYLSQNLDIILATFGDDWVVNECIPKFRFGNEFISDFVVVTGQSFHYQVTLIELEPPTEKPFTKDGKYAKRLNDALGQINDWFGWIHDNSDYFLQSLSRSMNDEYEASQISADHSSFKRLRERRTLVSAKIVIGRRDMLTEEDDKRRATIFAQTNRDIEILPYDRIVDVASKMRGSKT